jgi:hypothetical protein
VKDAVPDVEALFPVEVVDRGDDVGEVISLKRSKK